MSWDSKRTNFCHTKNETPLRHILIIDNCYFTSIDFPKNKRHVWTKEASQGRAKTNFVQSLIVGQKRKSFTSSSLGRPKKKECAFNTPLVFVCVPETLLQRETLVRYFEQYSLLLIRRSCK